ncbi:hypothetical protein B4096_1902 [Heyndrickxia coagulans]|nr:hypothetical protein B4096_1902 [Heyndrickxia coagulans]
MKYKDSVSAARLQTPKYYQHLLNFLHGIRLQDIYFHLL